MTQKVLKVVVFDPDDFSHESQGKVDISFSTQKANHFLQLFLVVPWLLNQLDSDLTLLISNNFPFGSTQFFVRMNGQNLLTKPELLLKSLKTHDRSCVLVVFFLGSNKSRDDAEILITTVSKQSSEIALNSPGKSFGLCDKQESVVD